MLKCDLPPQLRHVYAARAVRQLTDDLRRVNRKKLQCVVTFDFYTKTLWIEHWAIYPNNSYAFRTQNTKSYMKQIVICPYVTRDAKKRFLSVLHDAGWPVDVALWEWKRFHTYLLEQVRKWKG